jgi:hypothetical protein
MAFKALEKWEGGVNDSQTKAAGQAIRAALEQAQQASLTTGQSVSDVQNAGNSQTSQQVNSLTSQAIMGSKPAFEAALAHNGGNLSKTLDALNAGDTGTVNAALAGAQAATSTPEAQGVLATGGNKAPEGAAALKTNLQSKVAAANTGNRIAAAAQNKTDNAAVGKKQHASPTQAPDTSKVAATTGQVVGNHAAGLAQTQRQAKLSAGINSAASAINDRINEPGMQTWLKNFNDLNIPGVGQISSSKTTTADVGRMLGAIASTSPAVQDILINAADNGGKISPGGMDYISSQVTKMNDQRLNNK